MSVTFGQRLRELRMSKGLTQKRLAEYFQLSESTIGMYERDEREPSFQLIKGFADFFNVSIDYLFARTDQPTPAQSPVIREPFASYLQGNTADAKTDQFLIEYLQAPKQKKKELQQIWEIIKQHS